MCEKLADVTITFTEPKEKIKEDKESEAPLYDDVDSPSNQPQPKKNKITSSHPEDLILGSKDALVRTRSTLKPSDEVLLGLVSLIEPTSIEEALLDKDWILAMEEELNQFSKNDVWDLVQKPKGVHVIGTRWVFKNKLNEKGEVVKNKA